MSLQFNWDGLDISILGPACLAGLIVLSTHVPLGQKVLSRGIILSIWRSRRSPRWA